MSRPGPPQTREEYLAAVIGQPQKQQLAALAIAPAYVEKWLFKNRVTWGKLARGVAVWHGEPVTLVDIERLISEDDPVVWAWLNLVEKKSLVLDDVVVVKMGDPWNLFPVQGKLARCAGDLLVECGAEVGKTRDIVLRRLWRADTIPGSTSMVGGDSDQTLIPLWEELEFQCERNPRIGGGLVEGKCHIKPNRKKVFQNGSEIELRLAGHDGKNFRGGHFGDIDADEAVKWKNPQQWSEFFRSGLPGSVARIYSTPDGDYSCPFYGMSSRAVPVGAATSTGAGGEATADGTIRRFRKFHISKRELPEPFWSERRAAIFREQFGGEDTVGWITNVEGGWGSPSYSVFPMPSLAPCLKALEHYRIARVGVDRKLQRVTFAAARLNPGLLLEEDTANVEEALERESYPFADFMVDGRLGHGLGKKIASFFPDISDWVTPRLYWGGDLGSAQDPTELHCKKVVGKKWSDVFRLHLRHADPTEQADIVAHLDHSSGHRARWSLDNGSWGSTLVSLLTTSPLYETCPACPAPLYLRERLCGRGFGETVDMVDIETGEPLLNPEDVDPAGNQRPFRISNKEFGTRILERKIAAVELEIALDAGAGDQRFSGPQLMVNHTATGKNKRGERNFRGEDDHYVDAERQVALAIVAEIRSDGFVTPSMGDLLVSGSSRISLFGETSSPVGAVFDSGSLRGGSFF